MGKPRGKKDTTQVTLGRRQDRLDQTLSIDFSTTFWAKLEPGQLDGQVRHFFSPKPKQLWLVRSLAQTGLEETSYKNTSHNKERMHVSVVHVRLNQLAGPGDDPGLFQTLPAFGLN